MVLKKIKRDPSLFIDGHDFAIEKRIDWEPFAGAGNMRELGSEEIPSPRPKRYAVASFTSKAAVAVELYLVKPLLPRGKVLDGERIHGLDKADFSGWDPAVFRRSDSRHVALQSRARRGELRICKGFDIERIRRQQKTSLNFRETKLKENQFILGFLMAASHNRSILASIPSIRQPDAYSSTTSTSDVRSLSHLF